MDVFKNFEDGVYNNPIQIQYPYTDKEALKAYNAEEQRIYDQVKVDCFEQAGVVGNPQADKVWSKAYEMGHSNGIHEVANLFLDLVEIIL